MFCTKCGKQSADGAKFCKGCGAPLKGAASGQQASSAQSAPGGQRVDCAQQPPQREQQTAQQAPKQRGCLGRALDDVKDFGGYGRLAMLGLVGLVPVLNFCSTGYSLQWGANAARKDGVPTDETIVSGKNLSLGFKAWVLAIALSAAYAIVATLLVAMTSSVTFLLIVASIISWALFIAICLYVIPAGIRLALTDSLGSAFQFDKVFTYVQKKPGSFFFITLMPALVVGVPAGIILALLELVIGVGVVTGSLSYGIYYGMGMMLVAYLIDYLVIAFCVYPTTAVIYRALGHYIALYVPEWVQDQQAAAQMPCSSPSAHNTAPAQGAAVPPVMYADPSLTVVESPVPVEPLQEFVPVAAPVAKGSDKGTTFLGGEQADFGCRLRLVSEGGVSFELSAFPAVVGKGSGATCIIAGDESISRSHLCIHEYGQDGFAIEDLHSTNGTVLNGNKLVPDQLVALSEGDKLKLGDTTFTVRIG